MYVYKVYFDETIFFYYSINYIKKIVVQHLLAINYQIVAHRERVKLPHIITRVIF
jgi:hypothetical protein